MTERAFAPMREAAPALSAPHGMMQRRSREQDAGEAAAQTEAPRREASPRLDAIRPPLGL